MKQVNEILRQKVVNWMRKEKDLVIQFKTAKEAKEHFNLTVSERVINGWVAKRGLTTKEMFKEAKELKRKEIIHRFIGLEKKRNSFMNKAINMLSEVTKDEIIKNEDGSVVLNDKGKPMKRPTIPNVKTIQAINLFKAAIDNFTGFSDLGDLEKLEQSTNDSIRDFKHKKALDKEKLELDKIKMNIEMEKFGILKDQVSLDGKKKTKKKLEEFEDY